MEWNLETQGIRAKYLGGDECVGIVMESRVKYGGGVQHRVLLTKPFTFLGTVKEAGTVVLIDHEEVRQVFSAATASMMSVDSLRDLECDNHDTFFAEVKSIS